MDLVIWIMPKRGKGEEGVQKPENFVDVICVHGPQRRTRGAGREAFYQ